MKIKKAIDDDIKVLDPYAGVWDVVRDIAEQDREEPFFVCDTGELVRKHKIWKTLFTRAEPFYCKFFCKSL